MWDLCISGLLLLYEKLVVASAYEGLVSAFATGDFCRPPWSPPLHRTFVTQLVASATCDLVVLVRRFCYVRFSYLPLLERILASFVASDTWDLCCFSWSPPVRGTFVASVGRLGYVGPLSPQLVASGTWDLCRLS